MSFGLFANIAGLLAGLATGIGVMLAYSQLRLASQQARTTFEDSLSQQYRGIAAQLPVRALLGQKLSLEEELANLGTFYQYFDLSNEEVFLHSKGRIGDATWADWREGIQKNLDLPAFESAWRAVRGCGVGCFDELAQLVGEPDRTATGRVDGTAGA